MQGLPAFAQSVPFTHPDTVAVGGSVRHFFTLTTADTSLPPLKAGPAHRMLNATGQLKKTIPPFRGYLLKEVIEAAGPEIPEHREAGKYVVVVTASDGYTAVCSYNELMYAAAAAGAWLIPVKGLDELRADGPFVVICTTDNASAARYIKWVQAIELRKI